MFARPLFCLCLLAAPLALGAALAQDQLGFENSAAAQRALVAAQQQGRAAQLRAEALEARAASTTAAAERTAGESAALAARIQQSEARIAANEARIVLVDRQRVALRARMAEQQQPLIRLTAALQRLSRRPAVLSLLRPGSLREAVYLRSSLEAMLPEVERRTAGLRTEIARGRALQLQARAASADLRASEGEFRQRRGALAAIETRQRLDSRAASGIASRESERALALAEEARDLSGLVDRLGEAGTLRAELAALPGPVLRPAQPQSAEVAAPLPSSSATPLPRAPAGYMLPVAGQLVAGFGDALPGKPRSRGIVMAARGGAQAVAPAGGRVVFAGPYEGYGRIVIVEHPLGWTSLITGLSELDCEVGDTLVAGSPLGLAGPGRPVLTLELRRGGEPVNPLEFLGQ